MGKLIGLVFALLILALSQISYAATVLTDPDGSGIQWTFSETLTECTVYPCSGSGGEYGYYADGTIWVSVPAAGYVTLTAVSPAWTGTDHGSMVNPAVASTQGFKTNGEKFNGANIVYSAALNIETVLPYQLNPNNGDGLALSLVSSNTDSGASYTYIDFVDAAVITIVAAAPSANAFRPPWAGTDKSITITGDAGGEYTTSDMDYTFLTQLTIPAGATSLATAESTTDRIWFDYGPDAATARFSHPLNNIDADAGGTYGYQTEAANNLGQAATVLLLNYSNAQKAQLYINLVQYGIDVYAGRAAGIIPSATDGGHSVGRAIPLYIAGYALGDSSILASVTGVSWYEQCTTFFVESTDWYLNGREVCGNSNGGFGGTPPNCGTCTTYYADRQYDSSNHPAGTPEWGQRHCQGCTGGLYMDDSGDDASYRYAAHHIIYPLMFVSFTHNQNEFGDWGEDGRSGRSAAYEYMERHMANYSTINTAQLGAYGLAAWIVTLYTDNWATCTNGGCLGDTTAPTVTAFVIPSTSQSLTMPISTFTATDAVGVTGYCVNESATPPTSGSCSGSGWEGSAQTSYVFASEGSKTLYAWAKDAAGNISDSLNDGVTITLPTTSLTISSGSDLSIGSGSTLTWSTGQ